MSLKGVEMQIAVPRTNEATAVQNQLNQKPAYDQAALAQQTSKQADQQRNRSTEVDASDLRNVRDDGKGASGRKAGSSARRGAKTEEEKGLPAHETGHPFKGKHIDISL